MNQVFNTIGDGVFKGPKGIKVNFAISNKCDEILHIILIMILWLYNLYKNANISPTGVSI